MGLFNQLGFGDAQQFDAQIAGLDPAMLAQTQQDIQGIRDVATNPITGLSAGGQAAQSLATRLFNQEQDRFNRQAQGGQATATANASRFGIDSGGAERLAGQFGRQNLIGQQQLGQGNLANQANIAQQNITDQENKQFTALSALPQIQQSLMNQQFGADIQGAQLQNQQNAINQSNQAEQDAALGNTLGTVGGVLGGAFGGPLGSAIGGLGGKLFGGLFS